MTVIIPTYNRADTIKRSIDSVLGQSYRELELIIVDDGSSDNTVQIVNSYQDERLRLIRFSGNHGANVARNRGISAARGKYIAFQDSDDEWFKDKLEIQIKYMEEKKRKVCYCPYILVEDGVRTIVPEYAENKDIYEEKIMDVLRKKNVITTQSLIIHREVIETVGMFDETMIRLQDYEYAIRICQCYKIAYINKPLLNAYRMRECITNNKAALIDACKKILVKHINFVDSEVILRTFLHSCELYDENGIYSAHLNEILKSVQMVEKTVSTEKCIKNIEYIIYWYKFYSEKIFDKEFLIYGAGTYGKMAYNALKDIGSVPKCFWVTHKQQETDIEGIPILEIPDKLDRQMPVIIAVGKKIQAELINNLIAMGVKDYCIYPFVRI